MSDLDVTAILSAAEKARGWAIAPYSNLSVGAALQSRDGQLFTGCNIESASYGLTVCAERVAIWNALSMGATYFTCLAVVADTESIMLPCGACRQIAWEFCREAKIVVSNLRGRIRSFEIAELMPHAFDGDVLKDIR